MRVCVDEVLCEHSLHNFCSIIAHAKILSNNTHTCMFCTQWDRWGVMKRAGFKIHFQNMSRLSRTGEFVFRFSKAKNQKRKIIFKHPPRTAFSKTKNENENEKQSGGGLKTPRTAFRFRKTKNEKRIRQSQKEQSQKVSQPYVVLNRDL